MYKHLTQKYEDDFLKISHYARQPQMMPFVGKRWLEGKGLLIVTESHYLPPGSGETSRRWYSLSQKDLSDEEKAWTFTFDIVNYDVEQMINNSWLPKGHTLFRNIAYAMGKFTPSGSHIFHFCALMNYYQRPAEETGESISVTNEDRNFAFKNLCEVAKVINPACIFFCTSKGWRDFNSSHKKHKCLDEDIQLGGSAHASSPWWGRKTRKYRDYQGGRGRISGSDSFISFIEANKIFS